MRKALWILLVSPMVAITATTGLATNSTDRMGAAEQNLHVLELRVARLEERLQRLENGGSVSLSSPAYAPNLTAPQTASLPSSPPVKRSPREPASPQETGSVPIDYPYPAPSPHLTLAKARGVGPMQNPLALGPDYGIAVGAVDGPVVAVYPSPASPADLPPGQAAGYMSDNGPGLAPLASEPSRAGAAAPMVTAPREPSPPVREKAPARERASGKNTYDTALALYYKGDYRKAEEAFTSFVQSAPRSGLTPNAMYWQAECLYSEGKYDQAILVFKDVVNKYPKHDKAAASLLKAGYSYERMNDLENARFYWQILLDDFPQSAPAGLARKRLGTG